MSKGILGDGSMPEVEWGLSQEDIKKIRSIFLRVVGEI